MCHCGVKGKISSLGFKQRSVTWDSFGAGRANQSYLLHLPSYARNVTYTNVMHNAAGESGPLYKSRHLCNVGQKIINK
jgi:hypothetical protein